MKVTLLKELKRKILLTDYLTQYNRLFLDKQLLVKYFPGCNHSYPEWPINWSPKRPI